MVVAVSTCVKETVEEEWGVPVVAANAAVAESAGTGMIAENVGTKGTLSCAVFIVNAVPLGRCARWGRACLSARKAAAVSKPAIGALAPPVAAALMIGVDSVSSEGRRL